MAGSLTILSGFDSDKEHWLVILEPRDADLIANLNSQKVASLRIANPELIKLTTETTGCIDFQPKGFFDEEENLFYDLGGFNKEKLKS